MNRGKHPKCTYRSCVDSSIDSGGMIWSCSMCRVLFDNDRLHSIFDKDDKDEEVRQLMGVRGHKAEIEINGEPLVSGWEKLQEEPNLGRIRVYSKYGAHLRPERGTSKSAGWDLKAPHDINLPIASRGIVDTGIIVDASDIGTPLWYMLVPRSSAGFKYGIRFLNTIGVIDQDFCGPEDTIKVGMTRDYMYPEYDTKTGRAVEGSKDPYSGHLIYHAGERFCQLIISPHLSDLGLRLCDIEDLQNKESRGGLGSTGK